MLANEIENISLFMSILHLATIPLTLIATIHVYYIMLFEINWNKISENLPRS